MNISSFSRLKNPLRNKTTELNQVSLSKYFPSGTTYFYGYPAGEDSGFLNKVPPTTEELVAARAFSCAGTNVSVVGFAATTTPKVDDHLLDEFAIPQLPKDQLKILPESIDASVQGAERNSLIKQALVELVPEKSFVMAHPFLGDNVAGLYQIPTQVTMMLNDKSKMNQYIAEEYLPKRLAIFKNGKEFSSGTSNLQLPYVVKASSSSSGDGVYICQSEDDLVVALCDLGNLQATILIEECIDVKKNYVINFGIPSERKQKIDVFGIHEQLTAPDGAFLGGIIKSSDFPKELEGAKEYLIETVFPKIRDLGWYGIGGLDTLVDASGKFYFIDCNFRINSTSAYHVLVANKVIPAPLISFGAEFKGTQQELEECLMPLAGKSSPDKIMQLIAINYNQGTWGINAALFFNTEDQMKERIKLLLDRGIVSEALTQVLRTLS